MIPSKEYFEHLALREGFRNRVYRDTNGHLTVGTGHLLTPAECEVYKEGDLWEGDLEEQFREDAMGAWEAGLKQANMLGLSDNKDLVETLAHMSYQNGTRWYMVHKTTWRLLTEHKFPEAAVEAMDSKWFKQTPIRVKDFQLGLMKANMVL